MKVCSRFGKCTKGVSEKKINSLNKINELVVVKVFFFINSCHKSNLSSKVVNLRNIPK